MKKDLTGQTFGSWTVLRPAFTTQRVVWLCRCECGVEKEVRTSKLENGESKSCKSCSNKKAPRGATTLRGQTHSRKKPGTSGFSRVWRMYRRGAKTRGLEFKLPVKLFRSLTQQPCTYCQKPPSRVMYNSSPRQTPEGRELSKYVYGGIDRVDSSKGYTVDNCVSCCRECNVSKGTMSLEAFLRKLSRRKNLQPKS